MQGDGVTEEMKNKVMTNPNTTLQEIYDLLESRASTLTEGSTINLGDRTLDEYETSHPHQLDGVNPAYYVDRDSQGDGRSPLGGIFSGIRRLSLGMASAFVKNQQGAASSNPGRTSVSEINQRRISTVQAAGNGDASIRAAFLTRHGHGPKHEDAHSSEGGSDREDPKSNGDGPDGSLQSSRSSSVNPDRVFEGEHIEHDILLDELTDGVAEERSQVSDQEEAKSNDGDVLSFDQDATRQRVNSDRSVDSNGSSVPV